MRVHAALLLTGVWLLGAGAVAGAEGDTKVENKQTPSDRGTMARRNRWRQTGTSVTSSVSSTGSDTVLSPAADGAVQDSAGRSLFNGKAQLQQPGRPPIGPPAIIAPPAVAPPSTSIWGDSFSPAAAPSLPSPPSRPFARPPAPLPRPPAPPPQPPAPPVPPPPPTHSFMGVTAMSPGEAQISDIRCVVGRLVGSLKAKLTLPPGLSSRPVLHATPALDLLTDPTCRLRDTEDSRRGQYVLVITDLQRCGVQDCAQDGKAFLCLTVRFPVLAGLRLPEDRLAEIRCEPQDPTAEDTHAISVATSRHVNSEREASLFEGGGQSFQCEIALFRKDSNSGSFTQRVLEDTELELGEEVQLWSIVRANDGWQYSRLVEVVVHKGDGTAEPSERNTAVLVLGSGCHNPRYTAIARAAPQQEPRNSLLTKFTFRVFLFQDMKPGETITITARVIGCVEEHDCLAPTNCAQVSREGASRQKRAIREAVFSTTLRPPSSSTPPRLSPPPGILNHESLFNGTTNWRKSLAINVRRPESVVSQQSLTAPQCQVYLFLTVGVAVAFFLATIVFVIATLAKRRQRTKEGAVAICKTASVAPTLPREVTNGPTGGDGSSATTATTTTAASSSCDSSSETDAEFSWLPRVVVPATVRHRKRQINTELLNTFQSGTMPLPSCSGLLNYYGYLVVPRKAAEARPPPQHGGGSRTAWKGTKTVHGTLDRHFDPGVLVMASDGEDAAEEREQQGRETGGRRHHRHRRRLRHGKDRSQSRSRSRETGSRTLQLDQHEQLQPHQQQQPHTRHPQPHHQYYSHQVKIDVPPPPSVRPAPRPSRLQSPPYNEDDEENVYEEPVMSRPVMV